MKIQPVSSFSVCRPKPVQPAFKAEFLPTEDFLEFVNCTKAKKVNAVLLDAALQNLSKIYPDTKLELIKTITINNKFDLGMNVHKTHYDVLNTNTGAKGLVGLSASDTAREIYDLSNPANTNAGRIFGIEACKNLDDYICKIK